MLRRLFEQNDTPNKFILAMGQLIRQAREEKGWSQAQLAEAVYRRRPSISEIENGKMIPDAVTLFLIAMNLQKPLDYFIPDFYRQELPQEGNLSAQERELLMQFRRIGSEKQRQLIIQQVRATGDFEEEGH